MQLENKNQGKGENVFDISVKANESKKLWLGRKWVQVTRCEILGWMGMRCLYNVQDLRSLAELLEWTDRV
jgi:hypothetical protein